MLHLGALAVECQRIRFGGRHLGLHPRHVELGDVAGRLAALRQAQRVAVGADRLAHQGAFGIERAQLQVGLRHFGLHREPGALQQRLAARRVELGRVAGAREAAEQVELVREGGTGVGHGGRTRAGGGLVQARAAVGTGVQADLRQAVGIGAACQRTRLGQPRGRGLDVVVADVGLLDQRVQHRVIERQPPGTACLRLGRHGAREAGGRRGALLLELRRGLDLRHAGGHGGATGQRQGRHQRQQRVAHFAVRHFAMQLERPVARQARRARRTPA
jgi:hypothetical protein